MDNQQQNPNLLEIRTKYESGISLNKLSQEYDINIAMLRYKLPCYNYKWITRCSETTIEESE